jgi:hypothetical protein
VAPIVVLLLLVDIRENRPETTKTVSSFKDGATEDARGMMQKSFGSNEARGSSAYRLMD